MSKMKRDEELESNSLTPSQETLDKCLKRTASLLSHEIEESEMVGWRDLLKSFSSAAIEHAFMEWEEKRKLFFPKPKEILDLCEDFIREHRIEFSSCGECQDGWVIVTSQEKKSSKGVELSYFPQYAKRCQCWFQYLGKKAA